MCLAVLLLAYFTFGVFGRFPWKADEPHAFGVIWEILEENQWLVPHIADQPFVEKPPLVYWLGAMCAKAVPFLELHESSRLAVCLLVAIALIALQASARSLWPETLRWSAWLQPAAQQPPDSDEPGIARVGVYALLALVLVAGTLGFAEQVHKLTTDLGQLTGAAVALYGLIRVTGTDQKLVGLAALRNGAAAGFVISVGVGIGFLSKGLLVPGVIGVTWLLSLAMPAFRTRAAMVALLIAIAGALPWLAIWPTMLFRESPHLFNEWLWTNNVGRFVGTVDLGGGRVPMANRLGSLMLAAFPVALLAGCVVVRTGRSLANRERRSGWSSVRDAPGHVCVTLYLFTWLAVLLGSRSFRDNYLLPLLPAFVLLGMPVLTLRSNRFVRRLKRRVDRGFALAAVMVVLVWLALVTTGSIEIPWIGSALGELLPLPFALRVSAASVAAATGALALWAYVVRRDPARSAIVSWCAGTAMLWSVGMTLLLPWIDAARSYRTVFADLKAHLEEPNCVATWNLGESELAMFEYVTGLEATRMYVGLSGTGDRSRPDPAADRCEWMLVLSNRASGRLVPSGTAWDERWHGARPGDISERFVLYQRLSSRSDTPA
jgi:4-amino-4-deoxy-L-arabinose transferase-like glycosyltransferase